MCPAGPVLKELGYEEDGVGEALISRPGRELGLHSPLYHSKATR
jgi:hypothetical protein